MSDFRSEGALSVRFGTRWSGEVPGLLDYCAADGQLSVVLDYAVLRAARKDMSVARAAWLVGGREYATATVCVVPSDGTVRVSAREPRPSTMARQVTPLRAARIKACAMSLPVPSVSQM